ncbi:MAG: flagellar hook-associated protein FlgL [Gammaproteobacteria bacterium]|nr:flagellar hook-associated protein FlgL [Gammaproteobacteria bacterium]
MRISTSQFYSVNTQNILNRQSDVNGSVMSISEGKRVITAGDDSVAANSILNIRQEQALINQYRTNINYAETRINVEESAIESAENVMFRVKDLILQGNSIGNDDAARDAIAEELAARYDELLSLANSRDESGSYVFGGFQTTTPPFERQSDDSINYVGDIGQRETTVGPGVQVATSDSGQKVFMDVPNAVGDFKPTYSMVAGSGAAVDEPVDRARVASAVISDRSTYVEDDYTIDFVRNTATDEMELTVFDSTPTQVFPTLPATSQVYVAGEPITFNGVEVVITEQPQDGDSISLTPQDSVDIFTTIQQAIDWLKEPNGVGIDEAQRQLDIGHIIGNIDASQIKLGNVRAEIGTRLQLTESQNERHLDYDLTLETSRSSLEDLDMVEAISQFERQKLALQASQTAFSQIQGMSLLNYL